ncbi:MAG: NnrS family protein [Rhodopseudomonas palustris]|uniref:NnrS family protein n=1 Tax=Rhodopseudomonas palustris TaxID=1076 RepID=A0A933RV19_RHOPL|nr:NnrS family protein [Rhodopseudomonas palustris]
MSSTTVESSAAPKRKPVPRYRSHSGWTVLSAGFRPFFLFGAIFAAVAVALWLPVYHGELTLQTAFAPRDWHVHEMLYGYLPAVITGFRLTAIPNWTGRLPLQGKPLLVLVLAWFAGRLSVAFSADTGWLAALLVDASFMTLVALAAAREIAAGRNWRNLNVVALLSLLLAGNIAFHLEAHFNGGADYGIRAGIAVVILLISLIGGRITPSFTRNWLVRENPGRLPQPFNKLDMAIVAFSALTLLLWVVLPVGAATGTVLLIAGVLHLVRLARWAGDRTLRDRLLLVLHVGYLFVPIGFLLTACAAFGLVAPSAGIHAWMVGGAGIMTLAVMTRASLGHTGQELKASVPTQAVYLAALIAVTARVAAALLPAWSDQLLHVSALAWSAAFLGFAVSYGPTLLARGKPH